MKKIVLLSLALFSVAALRAEATGGLGAVRTLRTSECRVGPARRGGLHGQFHHRRLDSRRSRFLRTERVPRPRYQRADDRPDASPFPQRRDRPETAGRGHSGGHQRHRAEQRPDKTSKTSSATSSRCAIWPATTGSRWCFARCCPATASSWRPGNGSCRGGPTTQYDAGTLCRGAEDSPCGLPSGARQRQRRNVRKSSPQDGCHPVLSGYLRMEPLVVEGINRALGVQKTWYTNRIACKITDK